jgi:hypothetical protein
MSPGQLSRPSEGRTAHDRAIVLDANVLLDKNHSVFL